MEYVGDVYRPPGEWRSFLLQATVGCSHNGCTFCGMYKSKKFYIKDLDETIGDIRETAAQYNKFEKIFLCDGDAIVIPQENLLKILEELKKWFPYARLISTYAGPKSTLSKTPEQLRQLHEAGLGRAYLGVESGSDAVLRATNKGVDAATMLRAGRNLVEAGIDLWAIILIGLGGQAGSAEHIAATIQLLNEMQPNHLSSMNLTPVPGTKLYQQVQRGEFQVLTPAQSLEETRDLIAGLNVPSLHFTSDHASNYLPLKGTLPDERERLLALIDGALAGTVGIRSEANRGL
jgi:radical SAM superfamily enzyme YgiQ (UPF0313 family)